MHRRTQYDTGIDTTSNVSILALGDIPKTPYTGVSKSIPLQFLRIPRYCNSN